MTEDSKSLSRHMLKSFLAEDAQGIAEIYAEEAVMYGPNGGRIAGREACRRAFEAMFEQLEVTGFEWDDQCTQLGDVAYHWGAWKWSARVRATGAALELNARTTDVRRRGADGRWRIVVDHASFPIPPQ